MRRRQFLASASLGALSAGAGCVVATRFNDDAEPSHPLADTLTTVRVDNQSTTDHDVERNAWEALTFWEANSPRFVEFDFSFELVDSNPDLVIEYTDTPEGCRSVQGYSELVMGCAPLIRPENSVPDPIPITVVAGNRPYGEVRITTQHEIGHTLGLGHDDEPSHVMSNRPEDRIPLYQTRVAIWEQVVAAQEESNDAIEQFDSGTDAWDQHDYEAANTAFENSRDRFQEGHRLVEASQQRTTAFDSEEPMETVDLDGLRDRLGRIEERLALAVSFTDQICKATSAAVDDNRRKANSHLRDANEDIRSFNELDPPPIREIAVALGLIRGTERDGTVVDVGDEAFGYGQR
jgi:hypothetical protein